MTETGFDDVSLTRFNENEIAALEDLLGEFGPVDPLLFNVRSAEHLNSRYGYKHWITRSLRETLLWYGQYKHALSVDWDAQERERLTKLEAARAARAVETRDNVVMGAFVSLISKIHRVIRADEHVEFDVNSAWLTLTVMGAAEGSLDEPVLKVQYEKLTHRLEVIFGTEEHEDWLTGMHGQSGAREQSDAFRAVYDWCTGRDAVLSPVDA